MTGQPPDERLARVSYLPGVPRPERDEQPARQGTAGVARPSRPADAPADSAEVADGWYVPGSDPDEESDDPAAGRGRWAPTHLGDAGRQVDPLGDPAGETGRPSRGTRSRRSGTAATTHAPAEADPGRAAPTFATVFGRPDLDAPAQPEAAPPASAPRAARAIVPVAPEAESEDVDDDQEDDASAAARAERASMQTLTRRGVSVAEMRTALTRRELPAHILEAEIDRLERVGLLDDGALAETLVRTLTERKGLGRSGVTAELRRRGIDALAIEQALDDGGNDDAEAERALEVARGRARQLTRLDRDTAERRLLGFLQRRGYSGGTARTAARTALDESDGGGVRFR